MFVLGFHTQLELGILLATIGQDHGLDFSKITSTVFFHWETESVTVSKIQTPPPKKKGDLQGGSTLR